MSAVENLVLKLTRTRVKPHVRIVNGKKIRVGGYIRESKEGFSPRAAQHLYLEARKVEPQHTAAMRAVTNEVGGRLEGFDFRIKPLESLKRKVASRGTRDITDSVRYTVILDTTKYGKGARQVLKSLEKRGYKVETKNYWKTGDPYQGINVALTAPDRWPVELQIHTPESFSMKEKTHVLYEKFRVSTNNEERRRLWVEMIAMADQIPVPTGIEGLPTEIFQPYEDLPPLPKTMD